MRNYAAFDTALETLRSMAPELRNGAANHAPMAAEALVALGQAEAVKRWIESGCEQLSPGPETNGRLSGKPTESLGDMESLGAWQNFFARELSNESWVDVLERWLPRLIPGSMATGAHSIIRCGHAARALEHGETALRLEELAHALAYGAASYDEVLSVVPRLEGPLDSERAVAGLPLMELDLDRNGPPPRVVERLDDRPEFAAAVQQLAAPPDISTALTILAEIGARLYLGDADRHPLVLLHAVTGPAAVQLFIHHLSAGAQAHIWRTFAGFAAAFVSKPLQPFTATPSTSWDEIIDRSVESGDAHAVKLTEACKRQEALMPSPNFRAAAEDWANRILASQTRTAAERIESGVSVALSDKN